MLKYFWLALPLITVIFLLKTHKHNYVIEFHRTYEQNIYAQYDMELSFRQRRDILDSVCNVYSDPYTNEYHSVSKASKLEPARKFLLNHGTTFCIPDFENSDMVSDLMDQLIQDKSDSEFSYLEPCAKFNVQKLAATPMHSWRQEPVCNSEEKIDEIPNKVVAVQHPMERIATGFLRIQQTQGRNETFVSFVSEIVAHKQQQLPQQLAHLKPYWQTCNLCSMAFRPTIVIKYEYFNADIWGLFSVMKFTEYLESLPREILEVEEQGPSAKAKLLFSQIDQFSIFHLFEIFRADHELFGYDPRPYIDLGIK